MSIEIMGNDRSRRVGNDVLTPQKGRRAKPQQGMHVLRGSSCPPFDQEILSQLGASSE